MVAELPLSRVLFRAVLGGVIVFTAMRMACAPDTHEMLRVWLQGLLFMTIGVLVSILLACLVGLLGWLCVGLVAGKE